MARVPSRRPRILAAAATAAALVLGPIPVAQAAGGSGEASAANWLRSQQQSDGGFETAGYPGFEDPDAALALAAQAQTTGTWSSATARAALGAVHFGGGSGPTPLDALDAYATGLVAGPAATGPAVKAILLNAVPLGENPAAYDPAANGSPVNLTALMDAGKNSDGTYGPAGSFNVTLYATLANRALGRTTGSDTLQAIVDAQQSNGSWGYAGDPSGSGVDVDTTALAIQALIAGGRTEAGGAAARGMRVLARAQFTAGGWTDAFGTDPNPNTIAVAVNAVRAAGWDPTTRAWRDAFAPERSAEAYTSPEDVLRASQQPDGHFAGPYDGYGLNTSATSQALQSLLHNWLPVAVASSPVMPAVTRPAVFRPSTGEWWGTTSAGSIVFGGPGDAPVPANWTGSGFATPAVYRPSTGEWFVRGDAHGGTRFGVPGIDVPVPGDFDGTGRAGIAVFRTTTGVWYTPAFPGGVRFGAPGDIPVPGTWTPGGHDEFAVFRPSTGMWYSQSNPGGTRFGGPGDVPVAGKWSSPSVEGIAVFRPGNGRWYTAATPGGTAFGGPGDIPLARDWDGTGRAAIGIYRPATGDWFTQTTPGGTRYGVPRTDLPVPAGY